MRIAVEGCSHGCLDQIYSTILALDRRQGLTTSLLILCGDVQTLRNPRDLHCLAVPEKYKQMGDFHRYYSGQRKAPILTLMIGGNHEASNYLWELYHGGWVAPNIYYLGAAGCVQVGGLTIAGISGIYKSHDYSLGRFEQLPYTTSTVRSIYHTRQYDTFRIDLLSKVSKHKPDIVLSHDWPNTIEQRGDVGWLKKRKPFFVDEINSSSLGSPPMWKLLQALRPSYWFSAHLHVRFAALVKHSGDSTAVNGKGQLGRGASRVNTTSRPEEPSVVESGNTSAANAEEMAIDWSDGEQDSAMANPEMINIDEEDLDEDPVEAHEHSAGAENTVETSVDAGSTRFLALSKCLEGQDFLQILDVPAPFDSDSKFQVHTAGDGDEAPAVRPSLRFSEPWLAITKATHDFLSLERRQVKLPSDEAFLSHVREQQQWVRAQVEAMQEQQPDKHEAWLEVDRTQQFAKTAPAMSDPEGNMSSPPPWYTNPQTVALCGLLDIDNRINPPPPLPSLNAALFPNTLPQPGRPRPPILSEAEEIRRIEEAAQTAMKRKGLQDQHDADGDAGPLTLLDDDEEAARWKEGTG